jgi:hypothetical protein
MEGYNTTLVKDKKRAFIPYSFHVGFYIVKDTPQVSSCCPYAYEKFEDEIFTECAQDWEEVL